MKQLRFLLKRLWLWLTEYLEQQLDAQGRHLTEIEQQAHEDARVMRQKGHHGKR